MAAENMSKRRLGDPEGKRKTHAKKRILMATASPACNATTPNTKVRLVFASVALTTGHKFLIRKTPLNAKPIPTKM